MNVLIIGGSKNIGYYAAQRLLGAGSTVTFLLRNKACFDNDDTIKTYIRSGKARIVSGDALNEKDVRRAWEVAGQERMVDVMLFTVGGTPTFHVTKGFVITPEDLCTRATLNVLATMPQTGPQPKIILISSTGLSKSSHAALPLAMKPFYGYLLAGPHADKLGLERAVAHAAGWTWDDEEPGSNILPPGWKDRLPAPGTLTDVLVIRPALLTDGPCKADAAKPGKAGYRVSDGEQKGSYTVSRRDTAHFIVEEGLKRWDTWRGKRARVCY